MNNKDSFGWIKDIIHNNVIIKLKSETYANILDIETNTGDLLNKISQTRPDARYYAFSHLQNYTITNSNIKCITNKNLLSNNTYDLILSVFDFHMFTDLELEDLLKKIHEISSKNTRIVISDITSSNIWSGIILKLARIFNNRIKKVRSSNEIMSFFEQLGFVIVEKDQYKITEIWSAWIMIIMIK